MALGYETAGKLARLWPAGEEEGLKRLRRFLQGRSAAEYEKRRDFPAEEGGTARISAYLAVGALAARTVIREAKEASRRKGATDGVMKWVSEVAWRDFYRHVLVAWPHVCMFKMFKPEYGAVQWEENEEHFRAWCEGRTGFPIGQFMQWIECVLTVPVDAAMREMKETAWMHNRCRMVVASFLAKDLLLDWRKGEKFFMSAPCPQQHMLMPDRESLIDGDFASNNGGWGFSSSTGVDPQPYFRIFNPLLQSERFDADGEYIRRWVPELRAVEGKAVHDPYGRGAGEVAERNGYPRPLVDHRKSRERALEKYKAALQK
jgi:deoxyribodipyrimidine photo-lyase